MYTFYCKALLGKLEIALYKFIIIIIIIINNHRTQRKTKRKQFVFFQLSNKVQTKHRVAEKVGVYHCDIVRTPKP